MEKSSWKLCFLAVTADLANGHFAGSVQLLRTLVREAQTSKRNRLARRKLIEALEGSGQLVAAETETRLLAGTVDERRRKVSRRNESWLDRLLEDRRQFLRRHM